MKFKTWRLGVLAVEVVFVFVFPVFAFSQAPVSTPLTIDETTTPIRVDGHLEDWPATRMLLLNQASQAVLGRFLWKNPDSFSGRVFLTYDAAYLYVAVLVKRPAPAVNDNDKSALWNGDCLELFLSTDPAFQKQKRPTIGDYHIGFSPGTQCKNPRIYCFNKNKEIPGGRVIARKTNTGYLMEASVPLEFFGGLEVGKGKRIGFNVALDEGGSVGGNRVVQLDYSGHAESWETPSAWETLEWMGVAKASVPGGKEEDLYAKLVLDGTRNTTFLGFKTIAGMVADLNGKPLAGAKVGTWPKTKETVTGSDGRFVLDHVKTYDKTVVYGRTDGYASSLQPFLGSKALLTLNLQGLPFGGDSTLTQVSRLFYGQVFTVAQSQSQEGIKSLNLNLVKLTGLESTIKTPNAVYPELDKFMAFAKAVGAEPMVEVPLGQDPEEAARWVRYCNVEKNYHVRFWAIGNEPDRPAEKKDKTSVDDYGIYDYINDFRVFCNAMKRVDPSLFLVGPELASKYTSGKDDWITPFLRYDGDIVNLLSVHRYPDQCDSRGIQEALRREPALFLALRDKISENSDTTIPLVLTSGSVCAQAQTIKGGEESGPGSIWSALWEADEIGILLQARFGMACFSTLNRNDGPVSATPEKPLPAYWALKLLSTRMKGRVIPALGHFADVSVYATQDPKTKDVSLFFVNKVDHYYHVKILLNNQDADMVVDAGLNQRFDYEIPSFSISVLKIKADRSPGEAALYTSKMARAGLEPTVSVIRPW